MNIYQYHMSYIRSSPRRLAIFIFILVSCWLVPSCSMFTPRFLVDVSADYTVLQYSADHSLLGVASETKLLLLDGHKANHIIQQLNFTEPNTITAFAFSPTNKYLAVGFKNGYCFLYKYQQGRYVFTYQTYKSSKSTDVASICFSSDDTHAIIGLTQDEVVYWSLQDNAFQVSNFSGNLVFSVACSSIEPLQFVVSGGINAKPKLTIYDYPNVLYDANNLPSKDAILSVTYSLTSSFLHFSDAQGRILNLNISSSELTTIEIPQLKGKQLTDIRVSNNQKFMAVSVQNQKVAIVQVNDQQNTKGYDIQFFESPASTVALAGQVGFVFFTTVNNNGLVMSKCSEGAFYLQADDSCTQCQPHCLSCQLQPTNCYVCRQKYYLEDGKCNQCSVGCLACKNSSVCINCDIKSHFILLENTCLCQNGYFLKDDSCRPCGVGCEICLSADECIQCQNDFELRDGKCQCRNGTYLDGQDCKACSRGCDICENANNCTTCSAKNHYVQSDNYCSCDSSKHFMDDGTACICQLGYFFNVGKDTCEACSLGCLTCISQTECQICKAGLQLKDGFCKCIKSGQYIDDQGVCHDCRQSIKYCAECSDKQTCTQCDDGIHRILVGGQCQCQSGYFPDEFDVCQPCSIVGCLECQDLSKCKTCDASSYWQKDPQTSQCRCFKNYTRYEDSCVKCSIGCKTCDPTQCLQCDSANRWISDEAGNCICQDSYFQDKQICSKCMMGCKQCTRGQFCDQCDQAAHFQSKTGICVCQQTYFLKDAKCQSCSVIPHCQLCSSAENCLKCAGQFVLNATSHKCNCPAQKYIDGDKCSPCPSTCATCVSATKCTSCISGYELKKDECVKKNHTKQMVLIVAGVLTLAAIIFKLLI